MQPIRPRSDMVIKMRLYVTRGAPNSIIAVDNLNAIIGNSLDRCKLEIVDLLTDPLRAIDDGILVTPTLVKFSPPPPVSIVGDLSEKQKVIDLLGWRMSAVNGQIGQNE